MNKPVGINVGLTEMWGFCIFGYQIVFYINRAKGG